MPTTDSNGLVLYTSPDELTPLETAFNTLTASISGAFDEQARIFKVASVAARNSLANQRTPSKQEPLIVWREDISVFEVNDGTGWNGFSPEPNIMYINGSKYQKSGVITNIPSTPTFTSYGSGAIFARSITVPAPYTPPTGYFFRCECLTSTGYTIVTNVTPVLINNNITLRHIQVGNGSISAMQSIFWELCKA